MNIIIVINLLQMKKKERIFILDNYMGKIQQWKKIHIYLISFYEGLNSIKKNYKLEVNKGDKIVILEFSRRAPSVIWTIGVITEKKIVYSVKNITSNLNKVVFFLEFNNALEKDDIITFTVKKDSDDGNYTYIYI